MNGRILWGQLLAVAALVLLGIWGATQWTAAALGHQPELGEPWFAIAGEPVYPPPAFFWWWFAFDAYAPAIFVKGALIAVAGGMSATLVALAMAVWRARELSEVHTYGSARWASESDARAAGLLGEEGVILGQLGRAYLRHDGAEHVLCFAPTRSGKGVGLVVPTLLTWPGSCIVHDIKGENWQLTAGFRSRFGPVLLFDPTNAASSAYNPLMEVRLGPCEVRDVQNVADVLVDPDGSLEKRNHWEKTSHSLLVGAILHVLYAEPDKTLAGVAAFLSNPARPIEAVLARMKSTRHLAAGGVHPVIASAAQELLNKSENERSGVVSTAMSFLGLYRDPVVAAVTGRSDWRIADLVRPGRPTSLYLVVPPGDISRTKPLVRLMLNQIGRRLTEQLRPDGDGQRLLLMLDEFPALGRLDFFESALAFMAGYRIKAFLIAQSLNQIEKAYGQTNAILDNCHVRVCFATNDERTAKRVSDALGTATELRAMKNYAGHRLSPWLGHLMVSRSETARPLLTPGEVMQLPPDDELVMVAGTAPIRARKARYFLDARLSQRVVGPPVIAKGSAPSSAVGIACPQPADGRDGDGAGTLPVPAATPTRKIAGGTVDGAEARPAAAGRVDTLSQHPVIPGTAHPPEDDADFGEPDEGEDADTASQAPGGIRQEPDLAAQEAVDCERAEPANEFDFQPDPTADDGMAMRRDADRRMNANARAASLDPDDGIAL